jgi:hypothetical protein
MNEEIESITDWASIDDDRAVLLIKEISANITNDNIVDRNSDALEKRYRKSTGFISDLIFYKDLTDEQVILALLKKDTTIYL